MNAIASPIGHSTVLPPLPLYHFSVDQYHRLVDVGVLGDEEPVELLEGLIVLKGNAKLVPKIIALPLPGTSGRYPPLPVRRFTLQEYHRMIGGGIFTPEDRVELLEGWIVYQMTRNPPHDVALALVFKALNATVPGGWHCRSQSAITTDVSEPEPDVAVVRGVERDYSAAHPRPRDVGLIVEVADASVQADRDLKGSLYGRVGIPVYWLLNLPDRHLELYSDPTGPDPNPCYRQRRELSLAESVPLVLDGHEVCRIPVLDLFP